MSSRESSFANLWRSVSESTEILVVTPEWIRSAKSITSFNSCHLLPNNNVCSGLKYSS